MSLRVGLGYDIHRRVKGRKLILGGVVFDTNWGLDGHSDADVISHAIGDALLGAAGLGDLGTHFPPSDAQWKDVSSLRLLELIRALIEGRGGHVVNVDATLIAEEPKLAPARNEMLGNIAAALRVGHTQVSLKATTNEELGALGRKEGLAAMAVALVDLEERGPIGARASEVLPR